MTGFVMASCQYRQLEAVKSVEHAHGLRLQTFDLMTDTSRGLHLVVLQRFTGEDGVEMFGSGRAVQE